MRNMFKGVLLLAAMALAASGAPAQGKAGNEKTAASQQQAADLDAKYATNLLKPGSPAPDMALQSIDGKTICLADYKCKYLVVDFWASWCPDCRKDAPNVIAMYNKFHKKGVEFLGISFDIKRESWENGVKTLGIPYAQTSDLKRMNESDVAQAFRIKWIPTIYIINPEGNVALATVMSDKADAFLHSVYPDCAE